MQQLPIYLDYMATTPVDPRVAEQMIKYLSFEHGLFGNPASSTHVYGRNAMAAVEQARMDIASTVGCSPQEIVFTSGATEADNLAIIGAARFYQRKGKHLITVKTEHKAVLDSFSQLEKEGFEVSWLEPEPDGLLSLEKLEEAIRDDTVLASIMHVNNEIGVIQDIQAIGDLLRAKGVLFHVDAAQSAGKLPICLDKLPVDLMSFSAHKNYGPKGIGALYVCKRPRIRLQALSFGGGHECGLRSGTLATHQIVGMGMAFKLSEEHREEEQARILALRNRLWNGIKHLPGIRLNGHEHQRLAGNLNVSFARLDGDSLLLSLRELAVSTTSACSSASLQPSYVLRALGLSDELAHSAVRMSIGRFTSEEDIDKAIDVIVKQVSRLNEMLPV